MSQQTDIQNLDLAYSDPKLQSLLRCVNEASAAASAGWVLFISAMAYFFVALAGVTHQDFLLNTPVDQPILNVKIDMESFFLFAPLVLVFVHFGILIQHEMLSTKARAFDQAMLAYEGPDAYRRHPLRRELHSYFFTQSIAGPKRSKLLLFFLNTMSWTTLFLMPMLTLLAFQIMYLPTHDAVTTFWHRIYLVVDIGIFFVMRTLSTFLDGGFMRGLFLNIRYKPASFMGTSVFAGALIFFSFCVATIPDSALDKVMRATWSTPVPYGWTPDSPDEKLKRVAFFPTAYLFEGKIDEGKSRTSSFFSRNLVLVNTDMVKDKDWDPKETTLSLRGRDFSYATFDRADLKGTDFTHATLHGARFYETDLSKVKFNYANLQNADFRGADLGGEAHMFRANLAGADLRKIKVYKADMREAVLTGANLQEFGLNFQYASNKYLKQRKLAFQGADFRRALMQDVDLSFSNMRGANFSHADLTAASIRYAKLEGADFSFSNMAGGYFYNSDFTGAILKEVDLTVADLRNAVLHGVMWQGVKLAGATLEEASVWLAQPLQAEQIEFADLRKLSIKSIPDHQDSYNQITQQIELPKVRDIVEPRLILLVDRRKRLGWKETAEYEVWRKLNGHYKAKSPDKTADFYSSLICRNASTDGYAASKFLTRAALLYKSPSSRDYAKFVPAINVQRLADGLLKDDCAGAKHITRFARYKLGRKIRDYHYYNERIEKWRKEQQAKEQQPQQQ